MTTIAKQQPALARLVWQTSSWLLVGFALLQCFRGKGFHFWWVLAASLVPALRYAVSAEFRLAVNDLRTRSWDALVVFHAHRGAIPWQAVFLWGTLPFAVLFFANTKRQVGDNTPVFLAAGSLVREGNVELSEFLSLPDWPVLTVGRNGLNYTLMRTSGGVYSAYPAGPLQAALPVALVGRCVGADFDRIQVHDRLQKFTATCVSSACLGLFFLVALHLAPPTPAWIMTILLGVASAMFSTLGMGIWQHGGIVFWSLVFVLAEFRQAKGNFWTWTILQGLALGWMLPWRPTALLVAGPLGVWLLCRDPKRAILVAGVALIAFAPWACFNWSCYQALLGPTQAHADASCWIWTSPEGYLGVLFSPARGLFVYQPWLLLAGLWLLPSLTTRTSQADRTLGFSWSGLMATCAAATIINVILVGAWGCWWGGYCYGSRLNSEILPLAALICLHPLVYVWNFPAGRKLVIALILIGFAVHGSSVYFGADHWDGSHASDDNSTHLWRWDDPPFLYPILKHLPNRQ